MALGGDQGGSIRMPVVLLRHLRHEADARAVPYTGIMPIEIIVDHTGPMTATVADNALMLEVLAGPDGYDPRQYAPKVANYTQALEGGVKGHEDRRRQGRFRHGPNRRRTSTPKCGRRPSCSRSSARRSTRFRFPMHLLAPAIWTPIGVEGIAQTMMFGDGYGLSAGRTCT